jgi:hypothetical protein
MIAKDLVFAVGSGLFGWLSRWVASRQDSAVYFYDRSFPVHSSSFFPASG